MKKFTIEKKNHFLKKFTFAKVTFWKNSKKSLLKNSLLRQVTFAQVTFGNLQVTFLEPCSLVSRSIVACFKVSKLHYRFGRYDELAPRCGWMLRVLKNLFVRSKCEFCKEKPVTPDMRVLKEDNEYRVHNPSIIANYCHPGARLFMFWWKRQTLS